MSSFQAGGTELKRFLSKNQHTQRKLLNFENWCSGEYQFGCGISKMVDPKKQAFCPRINMLKGNFDTNYFEPLMIFSSWSNKN